MTTLTKLKKAQAINKIEKPKDIYVIVFGKKARVIDDLAMQYYVEHDDGKEGFVFKSEAKLCK